MSDEHTIGNAQTHEERAAWLRSIRSRVRPWDGKDTHPTIGAESSFLLAEVDRLKAERRALTRDEHSAVERGNRLAAQVTKIEIDVSGHVGVIGKQLDLIHSLQAQVAQLRATLQTARHCMTNWGVEPSAIALVAAALAATEPKP